MPSPAAPNGKDPRSGRFLPGNQMGKGNPTLRRVGLLRQMLLDTVTDDDFREVVTALVAKAKSGDLPAVKELLDRMLGKPAQAVAVTDADGEPLGMNLAVLQKAILDALKDFPSARLAVAVKLEELARVDGTGHSA